MMRVSRLVMLLFMVLRIAPLSALVDPVVADIEEQGWMANVLIKGSRSSIYSLFCKGSLIDPYWVLSSPACFIDPFGTIDNAVGSDKAEYAVALGNLGGLFKVEERIISADGNAMLLRLNRPASNTPLPLLYRTPAQLKGIQVRVYSNVTSTSLADAYFNPVGSVPVSCDVDGRTFFNDNRMCYVISKLKYLNSMMMASGRVIDPLSGDAPAIPLNNALTPDTSGDRLHVDFSANNSHPCHEDLGSPVIATLNGKLVQVGLVVAAGMTTGVPMCNGSFYNYQVGLVAQREFIEASFAKGQFAQKCPAKAEIKFERLSATRVRFYWEEISQASGYRALYTTALGYEPIQAVDLGNLREATVELRPGLTYSLALQAYNADCTGSMSRPISVDIAR